MQILVKTADDVEEWAIIELQGNLETQCPDGLHGKFIGDLHYTKQGKPVMIIGHHILQGEPVVMEKPLVVLERRRSCKASNGQQERQSHKEENVEFYVKAIVKKKLLFRDRPKPIVVNTSKAVK